MARDTCPGCGADYNGKCCQACGYRPFQKPVRRPFVFPKPKKHPLLGFALLLLIIALAVPVLRDWGLELKRREEAASAVETTAPVSTTVPTEITRIPETQPEIFDSVPVYFQSDYPFIRYGNGTIASSGCSITCLAMAASFVTDQEYTPDMLVWEFGGYGETNVQRLDHAIEQMQLPCEKNTDWRITKQALQEGHIAIALVDERSEFTDTAHFILLTGINEDGLYEVVDPFKPNYSEDYLEAGFEQGFPEGAILAGLEGSWVFRKDQMGSFRYVIEMPEFPKTRYGNYRVTDEDRDFLARFVWAAAKEESQETQQAVAEMVLNRIASPRFPYLVEQVVKQEDLYTWYKQMDRAQPDVTQYKAVTDAIYGPHVLPTNVYYGAPWLKGAGTEWGQLGSFTFLHAR